ncbi:uncharacterized protein LOC134238288 [Saccostrea cucullata]|uniref:uncharacterized protein LOC134238288 n=1 Tax=Saccostrea cuccullata TaxID=36930 RepID=UPI002ED21881
MSQRLFVKQIYTDMLLYDFRHHHQPQPVIGKRETNIDRELRAPHHEHHHHIEDEILLRLPHAVSTHPTTAHTTHPTHKVTTPTTTTTIKPTTTTVAPSTTSRPIMLNISNSCDHLLFVRSLAIGKPLVSSDAGRCTDLTNSQSEALLLATCGAEPPKMWTQGQNVMQNCNRIPKFTPISTFLFGQYATDGTALSGVFIKCTAEGFQMAAQICGHGPQIFELRSEVGKTRENADSYYIVQW